MAIYKYVNDELVPLTADEEAEIERIAEEEKQKIIPPTQEERLAEIEEAFAALLEGRTS